jgi:hypothetical protein
MDRIVVKIRGMGHIHGSRLIDFPLPLPRRKELVSADQESLHYISRSSRSIWTCYWIKGKEDNNIHVVVDMFRLQYNRFKPLENYWSFSSNNIYRKKSDNNEKETKMRI